MRRHVQSGLVAVVVLLANASASATATAASVGQILTSRASTVVDGDTFRLDGEVDRFRLWGIDAPEAGEVGAAEAADALRDAVANRPLRCIIRMIDQYRRPVATCALPDGRDLGRVLVDAGLACDYSHYSARVYRNAQEAAQRARVGVWGSGTLPSRWRSRCLS
jgi:endonuclease YncB( thermonuclease family)